MTVTVTVTAGGGGRNSVFRSAEVHGLVLPITDLVVPSRDAVARARDLQLVVVECACLCVRDGYRGQERECIVRILRRLSKAARPGVALRCCSGGDSAK